MHGESDGLPGLVVDRYGDTLVAQFLAAGTERWKKNIVDALLDVTGAQRLYTGLPAPGEGVRRGASARQAQGLRARRASLG